MRLQEIPLRCASTPNGLFSDLATAVMTSTLQTRENFQASYYAFAGGNEFQANDAYSKMHQNIIKSSEIRARFCAVTMSQKLPNEAVISMVNESGRKYGIDGSCCFRFRGHHH